MLLRPSVGMDSWRPWRRSCCGRPSGSVLMAAARAILGGGSTARTEGSNRIWPSWVADWIGGGFELRRGTVPIRTANWMAVGNSAAAPHRSAQQPHRWDAAEKFGEVPESSG